MLGSVRVNTRELLGEVFWVTPAVLLWIGAYSVLEYILRLHELQKMSYNTQAVSLCQCGATVAQQFCKLWVVGSNPITGSIN